ncbi:MAG TPA: hypothetical protein PK621_04435, partial [Syntrophales bacterium]|nr:hypothetical protein [Syntrophales bacterium]
MAEQDERMEIPGGGAVRMEGTAVPRTLQDGRLLHADFGKYKKWLRERFSMAGEVGEDFQKTKISGLYTLAAPLGIKESELARTISEFLNLMHRKTMDYDEYLTDLLPMEFCRWNSVAPILDAEGGGAFLISNPFDWELLDVLKKNTP